MPVLNNAADAVRSCIIGVEAKPFLVFTSIHGRKFRSWFVYGCVIYSLIEGIKHFLLAEARVQRRSRASAATCIVAIHVIALWHRPRNCVEHCAYEAEATGLTGTLGERDEQQSAKCGQESHRGSNSNRVETEYKCSAGSLQKLQIE